MGRLAASLPLKAGANPAPEECGGRQSAATPPTVGVAFAWSLPAIRPVKDELNCGNRQLLKAAANGTATGLFGCDKIVIKETDLIPSGFIRTGPFFDKFENRIILAGICFKMVSMRGSTPRRAKAFRRAAIIPRQTTRKLPGWNKFHVPVLGGGA